MKYIINSSDYSTINSSFPSNHTFGFTNENGEILFDDLVISSYSDFDYNAIFESLFSKTLSEYLSSNATEYTYPKIYNLVDSSLADKHFHSINYKTELTSNLHPKRTFSKGELIKVEWYSDTDLTDLVLIVDVNYTRGELTLSTERTTTRTWINTDNQENPNKKITLKKYSISPVLMYKEAAVRRSNVIEELKYNLITLLSSDGSKTVAESAETGRLIMNSHKTAIDNYIQNYSLDLLTNIQLDLNPILTSNMKTYIIDYLTLV